MDNDSQLISISAQFSNTHNWIYTAKYHHARINTDSIGHNSVSVPNKNINVFEASVQSEVGLGNMRLDMRHSSDGMPELGNDGSYMSLSLNWNLMF